MAASPLFNGNSDYINVKDNQGRHLFPTQVDNSKWKLAADAALEAINCAKENGHEKLYTFSLPINSISAATRKLLDIGEAVTENGMKKLFGEVLGTLTDCRRLQWLNIRRGATITRVLF